MGILRADRVAGLGGANAINGSVHFNGNHLDISGVDTAFGTGGNWTMECWINPQEVALKAITDPRTGGSTVHPLLWISGGNGGKTVGVLYYYTAGADRIVGTTVLQSGTWYHVAVVRNSGTTHLYVNGTSEGSFSDTLDYASTPTFRIGARYSSTPYNYNGYISNFRLINGTALYTANFTPPAQRLENISGTEILCCQSPGNVEQEATGKTITAPVPTNGAAAQASHFAPDKGEDYGTTFADNTKFDTLSYMVPPGGTTAESNRGRGLMMGGGGSSGNQWSGYTNIIDYVQIQSMGIAQDFGDLTNAPLLGSNGGAFSSTRGIQAGGFGPSSTNIINYVTIATTSNALDFGDLTNMKSGTAALSNQTRGIFAGGDPSGGGIVNSIDYITITTLGNSSTFGDLNDNTRYAIGTASPTRGIVAGGMTPTATNTIEYVTIATTGDAVNFGDMSYSGTHPFGVSNGTRGLIAGVSQEPNTNLNTIDYITIASTGNTSDFGDLTLARGQGGSMTNSIRGLFGRGEYNVQSRYYTNTIDHVLIATLGDAADFGDSTSTTTASGGGSDSQGGIS